MEVTMTLISGSTVRVEKKRQGKRDRERRRVIRGGSKQLAQMRKRFPKAFPANAEQLQPLKVGIVRDLMEALGCNRSRASCILWVHTNRHCYQRAILENNHRIDLDGNPVDIVDEEAKRRARAWLEEHSKKQTS